MSDEFRYDVFLSHSAKDKAVVREVAERLRADGLRVWFDEWVLKAGDSIPARIEEGLERSRVLVLCMSANAFGADWAQLEAGTFRFRDPLNKERRFIPLRLDNSETKESLHQFSFVDWSAKAEESYEVLFSACRNLDLGEIKTAPSTPFRSLDAGHRSGITSVCWSCDGGRTLSGAGDGDVRLWDVRNGRCVTIFEGHRGIVWAVALSPDGKRMASGGADNAVRVWQVENRRCIVAFEGHQGTVDSVAWRPNRLEVLSGSMDHTLRLWNLEKRACTDVFTDHTGAVRSVAWCPAGRHFISGSDDRTLQVWDVENRRRLATLIGHAGAVRTVAWSADGRSSLSGAEDWTLRLWDSKTFRCIAVLEGHGAPVLSAQFSPDGRYALSGSADKTLRIWDVTSRRCLAAVHDESLNAISVSWSPDGQFALSGATDLRLRVWDVQDLVAARTVQTSELRYTNAKVLLVGESGTGKTGISKRLVSNNWQPSDSTVGAWATQWKLPVSSGDGVEREIWLWDFGGQADQRLIHQLYMDETALAVLVFDGQKEDLFETLGQWDRDLTRAASKDFTKILAAGRVDAGGLRVSRNQIEAFKKERGYRDFLETSAKANLGCEELKKAILDGIQWENIPWRSSPVLFKRLKEEIIRLKDAGRVLMRFNELRDTLRLRLTGEDAQFKDEELKAVVGLLAGPGVVWELKFGSWVLLQPERINAYAQAVIQTMQADAHERGCLPEEQVLKGELKYHSSMARLGGDEERFVLLAMHQTLVERGLCLRQPTAKGNLLIFPSYYRRERAEQVRAPAVLVSYYFNGFLDEIYATLVVRLHHTEPFHQDQLWRYAADFKTHTGKQLGVKLTRRTPGAGDLEVYFDAAISMEEKIIFSKFVHEHLLQHAKDVVRLRHYVCAHCGTPVGNREVAMNRLEAWLQNRPPVAGTGSWVKHQKEKSEAPSIVCSECEKRVSLWDELEQCFASPEIQERVRELQEKVAIVLTNESKERALVGEVISTVALSGQISREFNVSDKGIDMEIEFNDDRDEATGQKLYLQLKSGDSYLRERRTDGAEIFTIKDERHERYWATQQFPVLLVIRTSDGEVRWMEIRDYLKQESDGGKKRVKQIVFAGERFDVMSVRRWRKNVLGLKQL